MGKVILKIAGAVCIIVLLGGSAYVVGKYLDISQQPYHVSNTPVNLKSTVGENANNCQRNAHVEIFPVGETLYYYVRSWPWSLGTRSKFDKQVCTIVDGELNAVLELSDFFAADNRFIYGHHEEWLVAYDTQQKRVLKLAALSENSYNSSMESNGMLQIVERINGKRGYVIKDGVMVESASDIETSKTYVVNGMHYAIRDNKVFCNDTDISENFAYGSLRCLVPYQNGLLLLNDGQNNLLYYIDFDGQITSLFPEFAGMASTSSVNFYDNYIFVSFKRWESYDETGKALKSFENDAVEGTYRIDIRDNTILKISNNIYSGMYIYDGTCILACSREGDIHQLSFNGELMQVIVD